MQEGFLSSALGSYSHSEGYVSSASGKSSHAEGVDTYARGEASHAEGDATIASGSSSHAEGYSTGASANGSHAEGRSTIASGDYAHAEGYLSWATKEAAHAQNYGTRAASQYQTALGKYNVVDANDQYAVIIGNGTSDSNRSNALTVDWDGNTTAKGGEFAGTVKLKSTNIDRNGSNPSSVQYSKFLQFDDKDGDRVGVICVARETDGRSRISLYAYNDNGGTEVSNSISVYVAKDGTRTYGVADSAAFRSAIGAQNAANLTTGTLPSGRLPTVPIDKGGTGATTAAAARTNLGFTRANLAEKMHAVTIFSGLSVANGGTLGTSTAVFDYQFFMVTSDSNGQMFGYRTGSASSAGGIRAIGGFDDGSTSRAYVCQLAVSTAGKVTNTCCSWHDLATQSGAALNITGLYGLR